MLEDDQKLRLIAAAVKMQDIISVLEMDLEFETLSNIRSPGDRSMQHESQTLEYDNAELDVVEDDLLTSQPDHEEDLYSSLNKTIGKPRSSDVGRERIHCR